MIIPLWKNFGSAGTGNVPKRTRKRKAKPRPEYSTRIEALRGTTKQRDFAAKFPVSPSRVSEWESGKRPPVAEGFYRLGSLADNPDDAIWFWKQAGLDDEKLLAAARKLEADRFREAAPLIEKGDVVLVPRFRETLQGREEAGPPVPLPKEFIPNPASTICFVVDEKATGIADSPKALFILDQSEKDAPNLLPFWGQVVFARYDPDLAIKPRWNRGISVGRLVPINALLRRAGAPGLVVEPKLFLLTDLMAQRSPEIGFWAVPSFTGLDDAIAKDPNLEQNPLVIAARKGAAERARSELRLDSGWSILGRVLGRLKLEGAQNF